MSAFAWAYLWLGAGLTFGAVIGWIARGEHTASVGARRRAEAREVERWAAKKFHKAG